MAPAANLPCDGDGVCMVCKLTPTTDQTLRCKTCATPWHGDCLLYRPAILAETLQWECPDCMMIADPAPPVAGGSGDIVKAIFKIEADTSLSPSQKARKRQELMSGAVAAKVDFGETQATSDGSFICSVCKNMLDRPVSTPCGHNFCLKCFQKSVAGGRLKCPLCRSEISRSFASQPRINPTIVFAMRLANMPRSTASFSLPRLCTMIQNSNRPDTAFTTSRAKKSGKANACCGKTFVTVNEDHFGPIPPEHDPVRNTGVLVGESWADRMDCKQWGTHRPHVAGIGGQSGYGAQSVALSGGYVDDEDHGEWFLYTGSGGRDLSGNKRTNNKQAFDQTFDKMNEALRVSCLKGYPVRVVRSHKEKRSSYAPEGGVRYDGVYRIEKCWRKLGVQGFKVCRYLFVRCDNEPAPWTSDVTGDRPRPLPKVNELKGATDITERKSSPSWDYDEEKGVWLWKKPPPLTKKPFKVQDLNAVDAGNGGENTGYGVQKAKRSQSTNKRNKLLKQFNCLVCRKLMELPVTTPCAHNFCKKCLEDTFAGQEFIRQRKTHSGRTLRAQKTVMKCPCCPYDISEFLANPQVNRELMGVIESFKKEIQQEKEEASSSGGESGGHDENIVAAGEKDEQTDGDDDVEDSDEMLDETSEDAEDTDEFVEDVAEKMDEDEKDPKAKPGGLLKCANDKLDEKPVRNVNPETARDGEQKPSAPLTENIPAPPTVKEVPPPSVESPSKTRLGRKKEVAPSAAGPAMTSGKKASAPVTEERSQNVESPCKPKRGRKRKDAAATAVSPASPADGVRTRRQKIADDCK